jgi:succinyl-CoA synthetase beta subunit
VDDGSFREGIGAITQALTRIPNAGILIEEEVSHESEWLVSVDFDRAAGDLRVSFSAQGGMDAAQVTSVLLKNDEALLSLPEQIRDAASRLVSFARQHDALSVEVNPFAIRSDGSGIALDAKVEFDDAAFARHPEWSSLTRLPLTDRQPTERETAYTTFLEEGGYRGTFGRYVELDGDIALVLSGGGASLVALDALRRAGLRAANYCEISGNPDAERTTRAAKIVLSHPGIKALWMAGSFANFTDIQATAMAVLAAVEELNLQIPIVIRRDGPNADAAEREARVWAEKQGVTLIFHRGEIDLDTSAQELAKLVKTI